MGKREGRDWGLYHTRLTWFSLSLGLESRGAGIRAFAGSDLEATFLHFDFFGIRHCGCYGGGRKCIRNPSREGQWRWGNVLLLMWSLLWPKTSRAKSWGAMGFGWVGGNLFRLLCVLFICSKGSVDTPSPRREDFERTLLLFFFLLSSVR